MGRPRFQSTCPRGARRLTTCRGRTTRSFQSTRPRGARLAEVDSNWWERHVSIHAPVRGATAAISPQLCPMRVSIHAPARGATIAPRCPSMYLSCFNPRARAGRDPSSRTYLTRAFSFNPRARAGRDISAKIIEVQYVVVSIHAPARGATVPDSAICPRLSSFNPRARAGRDAEIPIFKYREDKFQSTRPRGARHVEHPVLHRNRHVSIHAPARGATSSIRSGHPHRFGFNPRARAGRDDVVPPLRARRFSFNPRARAGRDSMSVESKHKEYLFQSTRPRGARRI